MDNVRAGRPLRQLNVVAERNGNRIVRHVNYVVFAIVDEKAAGNDRPPVDWVEPETMSYLLSTAQLS